MLRKKMLVGIIICFTKSFARLFYRKYLLPSTPNRTNVSSQITKHDVAEFQSNFCLVESTKILKNGLANTNTIVTTAKCTSSIKY